MNPDVKQKIATEAEAFLDRAHERIRNLTSIDDFTFNPFLAFLTAPIYGTSSPFEQASNLVEARLVAGLETSFGKFIEDKVLPLFGAESPPERESENEETRNLFKEIDKQITRGGTRYLMTIKAGPWTMNDTIANRLRPVLAKLALLHSASPLVIGITYGRHDQLTNKPALAKGDLTDDQCRILVGAEFWEFVSGDPQAHLGIFEAIKEGQRKWAAAHADETLEELVADRKLALAKELRKAFKIFPDADFWDAFFKGGF